VNDGGWKLNWNRLALHYALRVIVLLGLGYYILYLWKTDQLLYYIAPRMMDLIVGSSIALIALATYQFYLLLGVVMPAEGQSQPLECDCPDGDDPGHVHGDGAAEVVRAWNWRQMVGYSLLLFPLLVAVVLPESALSSEVAAKKGMNLTTIIGAEAEKTLAGQKAAAPAADASGAKGANAGSAAEVLAGGQPTDDGGVVGTDGNTYFGGKNGVPLFLSVGDFDRDFAKFSAQMYAQDVIMIEDDKFMEYLTAFDLYLDQFQGKRVELTGFVYREEGMKPEQMVVGRLAIQCCSADASPFGVMTSFADAKRFADNTWVRVTGVIGKTSFDEADILQLEVEQAVAVPAPSQQYVYPNYDFMK
jgi:uncharacterized repeat protein (TIGR03943 family)